MPHLHFTRRVRLIHGGLRGADVGSAPRACRTSCNSGDHLRQYALTRLTARTVSGDAAAPLSTLEKQG